MLGSFRGSTNWWFSTCIVLESWSREATTFWILFYGLSIIFFWHIICWAEGKWEHHGQWFATKTSGSWRGQCAWAMHLPWDPASMSFWPSCWSAKGQRPSCTQSLGKNTQKQLDDMTVMKMKSVWQRNTDSVWFITVMEYFVWIDGLMLY